MREQTEPFPHVESRQDNWLNTRTSLRKGQQRTSVATHRTRTARRLQELGHHVAIAAVRAGLKHLDRRRLDFGRVPRIHVFLSQALVVQTARFGGRAVGNVQASHSVRDFGQARTSRVA